MIDSINWHSCFFLLFAAVACGFAAAVVLSGNIVRMACCLVVALTAVAGLFFLAGAEFLGAAQLMVYVGGTMVLLVFGVMLTARGPFVSLKTGGGQWVLVLVIGAALFAVLLQTATSDSAWDGPRENKLAAVPIEPPADPAGQLGLGLLGVREDRLRQDNKTLQGGMSGYLLAFEIISVHLVVVLVGAAYLARAKRRGRGSGARDLRTEGRDQRSESGHLRLSDPPNPEPRIPNPESRTPNPESRTPSPDSP